MIETEGENGLNTESDTATPGVAHNSNLDDIGLADVKLAPFCFQNTAKNKLHFIVKPETAKRFYFAYWV